MSSFRTVIYMLMLLLVLVVRMLRTTEAHSMIAFSLLIAALASLVFLLRHDPDKTISRIFFRPVHLFLLAYIIVFFQKPLDYISGYRIELIQVPMGDLRDMPYCVELATIGLLVFFLGYCLLPNDVSQSGHRSVALKAPLNIFKLLTSLTLMAILIVTPRNVLFGGYSQQFLDQASSFNYLSSWCRVFISGFYVQFACNHHGTTSLAGSSIWRFIKSQGIWMNANLILYSIIILNLGDRGPLIVLATALYLTYITVSHRTMPKWVLLLLAVGGISFSSLLGQTKQHRADNSIVERIEKVMASTDETARTSLFPATEELALSYRCLPYAVESVPDHHPYTYGLLQVSYLLAAIPFSATIVGSIVALPENSAYMISHFIQGTFIDSGDGSNCVADFYIDGGLTMVVIGMFLWGLFCRYFESRLLHWQGGSLVILCISFYFLIHCIYMPRSIILSSFKYAVWLALMMVLYHSFYRFLLKKA